VDMRSLSIALLMSAVVFMSAVASTLFAAQCDPSVVTVSGNAPLAMVNNSGKTIVNYVLVDSSQRTADGKPRIYTGKFASSEGVQTGKSISFGSGSPSQITIDYVRFADGSSCGNGTTREAKAAGAH
jgi:hypothetical protein